MSSFEAVVECAWIGDGHRHWPKNTLKSLQFLDHAGQAWDKTASSIFHKKHSRKSTTESVCVGHAKCFRFSPSCWTRCSWSTEAGDNYIMLQRKKIGGNDTKSVNWWTIQGFESKPRRSLRKRSSLSTQEEEKEDMLLILAPCHGVVILLAEDEGQTEHNNLTESLECPVVQVVHQKPGNSSRPSRPANAESVPTRSRNSPASSCLQCGQNGLGQRGPLPRDVPPIAQHALDITVGKFDVLLGMGYRCVWKGNRFLNNPCSE